MRIDGCRRIPGEMFSAACDPLPFHRLVERAGVANDLLDRFSVTTATQRIVCIVVKGNVEHWTKVEIEAEKPEQSSGDIAVFLDKMDIVLVPQLLCVGWLVPD